MGAPVWVSAAILLIMGFVKGFAMKAHELLALAALYARPDIGVTKQLLAAVCWTESRGAINALGDRGKAYGLAQFHGPTWSRFASGRHLDPGWRRSPGANMETLVREFIFVGRTPQHKARFHNSGKLDGKSTAYTRRVLAAMRKFKGMR